uniref:lactate utilization protein n=1 Tax=Desulfonatronospira sp. TaxID=1962951 RepID=UPI0025C1F485
GLDRDALTGLQAMAKERDIKVVSSGLRKYASGLDMGLAVADLGLAETGTLVLECSSEDLRLSSMLCEINILVLPVSRMRTGTDEAEEELSAMMTKGSAYLSFITGASRTADIERVLALGVHGPLELHILLWEDD